MNEQDTKGAPPRQWELPQIGDRRVMLVASGPPMDKEAAVRTLMRVLTGGDPVGYVRKIQEEKLRKERE